MNEKKFPELTVILLAFNRAQFVGEAIRAALNQNIKSIEIVISDDCSSDNTFSIIKESIKGYSGPHKIILNQNQKNLGVVGNINKAISLSSGELVVQMGDDDISLPNRVQRTYEEWCSSGKKAHSIFFNARIIDQNSSDLGIDFVAAQQTTAKNHFDLTIAGGTRWPIRPLNCLDAVSNNWVLGATQAFSRKVFDVFGPLREDLPVEDHAIPFRALLLGEIRFVNENVILYRRHGENYWPDQASDEKKRKLQRRELRNVITTHQQAIQDLNVATKNGLIEKPLAEKIQAHCRKVIVNKGLNQAVYGAAPLQGLWRFFRGDLFEERRAQYYVILLKMTLEKAFHFKGFHLLRKLLDRSRPEKGTKQKPVMEKQAS